MPVGVFSHTHDQETPATTWTVVHQLGTITPVVDVYIDLDGSLQKIIPKSITVVDNTTVQVVFSEARTGKAAVR